MTCTPCVISAADHTGWAHFACVAAPRGVLPVIERRGVTTIDAGSPTMPYQCGTRTTSFNHSGQSEKFVTVGNCNAALHQLGGVSRITSYIPTERSRRKECALPLRRS